MVLAGIVSVIVLAIILIVNIVGKNTREKDKAFINDKKYTDLLY